MSGICMKINVQVQLIFKWIASHEDSFWHRGKRQLGSLRLVSSAFSKTSPLLGRQLSWMFCCLTQLQSSASVATMFFLFLYYNLLGPSNLSRFQTIASCAAVNRFSWAQDDPAFSCKLHHTQQRRRRIIQATKPVSIDAISNIFKIPAWETSIYGIRLPEVQSPTALPVPFLTVSS